MPNIEELYEHQKAAVGFLMSRPKGGAVFAEPGTGKTRIGLEYCLRRVGSSGSCVIIGPPGVLPVWEKELKACFPVPFEVHDLQAEPRPMIRPNDEKWHFFLSSYFQLNKAAGWYIHSRTFDICLVDEAHYIKNYYANRTRETHKTYPQFTYRVVLTGTPTAKHLLDVYPLLNFVDREIFGKYYDFMARYALMGGYRMKQVKGIKYRTELLNIINYYSYTVKKEDCLDLPPLTMEIVPFKLAAPVQKFYDQLYAKLTSLLKVYAATGGLGRGTVAEIGPLVMRLQQLTGGHAVNADEETVLVSIDRLECCMALLDDILLAGKKCLIFARFINELDLIQDEMNRKKIVSRRIDGNTKVQEREKHVAAFKSDSRIAPSVLLMQSSLGVGYNLVEASYEIFYSYSYSWIDYKQAMDRPHRPGQKEPVTVYMLCAENTIDEKVLEVLRQRKRLSALVLGLMKDLKK